MAFKFYHTNNPRVMCNVILSNRRITKNEVFASVAQGNGYDNIHIYSPIELPRSGVEFCCISGSIDGNPLEIAVYYTDGKVMIKSESDEICDYVKSILLKGVNGSQFSGIVE